VKLRKAEPADLTAIRSALSQHAESEGGVRPPDADLLEQALFGSLPAVHVVVVETDDNPPRLAGMAMWYPTFSSWALATGIWLEDLFVHPEYRRAGVGRELMAHLRGLTAGRIEWDVTNGNERAERFYQQLGAVPVPEFTRYRWVI
jgi:GNAT superfamily N-acetyltransferase